MRGGLTITSVPGMVTITADPEGLDHLEGLIQRARATGMGASIARAPGVSANIVVYCVDDWRPA